HRYGKIFTLARSARAGLASRMIAKLIPTLAGLALVPALGAQAPTAVSRSTPPRPFSLDDVLHVRDVRDPEISPDGAWVAYTVSTPDTSEDRNKSAVWMAKWDGTRNVRLTTSKAGENTPRWSPDGRWLAFLSSREDEHTQLWLLDRSGGGGRKLTSFGGDVEDYVGAPGGQRLARVVGDAATATPKTPTPVGADARARRDVEHPEVWRLYGAGGADRNPTRVGGDVEDSVWPPDGKRPAALVGDADTAKPKTPAPVVIDRFQFKQHEIGYLGKERRHLYLVDVETGHGTILTPGPYDELLPAWSPNGRSLVFVSKRRADFDRDNNWDLYVMDAVPGAVPRQLTTFEGPDNDPEPERRPAWSPDGRSIGYLQGGPLKLIYYGLQRLAVVPAAGGTP